MREYKVRKGETLSSIAHDIGLPDAYTLKTFHNFNGPIEKGIGDDIREGMILTIPDPHEVEKIYGEMENKRAKNADKSNAKEISGNHKTESNEDQQEKKNESEEKAAGEHDGKLFVIQKGKAICDKGTKFPQFKVISHKKLYVNDEGSSDDYLAVTQNDVCFNPSVVPFGNCSLQNGKPCTFSSAGQWQKFYQDVKVMDNALITEISELQCTIGGKIKVLDHGQREELTKQNFRNADRNFHSYINPLVDLRSFIDDIDEGQLDAY